MKHCKKALLWLWLLTKRLYKKPTFLAILLLIPVLIFGYQGMTQGESGMMTIALAKEADDPITQEIFASLKQNNQLFRYRLCDTPEQAELMVETGKADAAWIFPGDMLTHMDAFLEDPGPENSFIRVLQREQNVALLLTRERLSGAVYHHMAQRYYLKYVRAEFPDLEPLSDEELMTYYDNVEMTDNLFSYDTVSKQKAQQVHYLMTPIRGMLAIVIVLCGLATAMYYIKDSLSGTFGWVPERLLPIPELGCQAVSVLNIGAVALLSLILLGLAQNFFLELLVLLLYTLSVAAFCMLLRVLLGSIRAMGSVIPLLVVAMLLVCPVFFDFGGLRLYQFLLPPTYYINAVFNPLYILYMVGYIVFCFGLYLLLRKLLKRL